MLATGLRRLVSTQRSQPGVVVQACRNAAMSTWNGEGNKDLQMIAYPQYSPRDPDESIVKKRARLTWQSRKRGIKENCLIFGTFADKHLKSFSMDQLNLYDKLLNKADNEWEIYYWMTGSERVPEMFDNEIMRLLQIHCKNEGKVERFEQPPLNYEPDLEETDTSESDGELELELSSKKKSFTEKVVKLKEQLVKEDQNISVSEAECTGPNSSKSCLERTSCFVEDSSETVESISVEKNKSQILQLEEKQAVLRRELSLSLRKKDIESADSISDQISENEKLIEFNKSIVAKDYLEQQKNREHLRIKRKRKKLNWV